MPFDEVEAKRLLAEFGLPVVRETISTTADGAVAVARRIGFPVAVKTAAPEVPHKSDAGGVALGLSSGAAVRRAYHGLRARFGPRVVVQAMVPSEGAVELFLGMVRDSQFGPLVSVGLGGVFVETLADVVTFLPPVSANDVLPLLRRLRGFGLLTGGRGRPPVDLAALTRAIAAFSVLCQELGPSLDAVDVNPLIAGPTGVVAVDALVIPNGENGGEVSVRAVPPGG